MHKLVLIRHGESTWNLEPIRHYYLGDAEAAAKAAAAVAAQGKQ